MGLTDLTNIFLDFLIENQTNFFFLLGHLIGPGRAANAQVWTSTRACAVTQV
jgi:hypothetical protein